MRRLIYLFLAVVVLPGIAAAQNFRIHSQPGAITEGIACFQLPDSNYIAIANTSGFNSINQLYLLSINPAGNFRSDHAIPMNGLSRIHDAVMSSTSQLALSGLADINTSYDGLFMLCDTLGQVVVSKSYGGPDWDDFLAIAPMPQGKYCLAGYSYSFSAGGSDAWIIGIDANGDSLWSLSYGGAEDEVIRNVTAAPWGMLACGSAMVDTALDVLLIAFDEFGDTLWTRTWGSPSMDIAYSAAITSDSGFVIAGQTAGFSALGKDGFIAKFNKTGVHQWTQVFPGSKEDLLRDLIILKGDSIAAGGTTTSFGAGREEFSLYLTNANGSFMGGGSYGGFGHDYFNTIHPALDGGFILTGSSTSFGTHQQGMLITKTGPTGLTSASTQVINAIDNPDVIIPQPFPNPGNDLLFLPEGFEMVRMYNLQGQLLATFLPASGSQIDISPYRTGIYFLEIAMKGTRQVTKYVISR